MTGLQMKYFVLNPNKDDEYGAASRLAMEEYAKHIKTTNPELHKDITWWVENVRQKLKEGPLEGFMQ